MGAARHTRFRENPYRTGLLGNPRERPGPQTPGSTPVRAGRIFIILVDFSLGLMLGI